MELDAKALAWGTQEEISSIGRLLCPKLCRQAIFVPM